MREIWELIIGADLVFALIMAAIVFCEYWGRRRSPIPALSRALTPGQKPVIVGFLAALFIVLIAGFFLYGLAYPPGSFRCMALPAIREYGAFALPCIAGIAAGLGFIYKKTQEQINKSLDLRFYMASVVTLGLALVVYIADHPRPVVVVSISLSLALASIVCLWIAMGLGMSWKSDQVDENLPEHACCESDHSSWNVSAATEQDVAKPKDSPMALITQSQTRSSRNDRLNNGAKVGSSGFFGVLFAALLAFQLLTLVVAVSGSEVQLRTLKKDANEQAKCAAEEKAEAQ